MSTSRDLNLRFESLEVCGWTESKNHAGYNFLKSFSSQRIMFAYWLFCNRKPFPFRVLEGGMTFFIKQPRTILPSARLVSTRHYSERVIKFKITCRFFRGWNFNYTFSFPPLSTPLFSPVPASVASFKQVRSPLYSNQNRIRRKKNNISSTPDPHSPGNFPEEFVFFFPRPIDDFSMFFFIS